MTKRWFAFLGLALPLMAHSQLDADPAKRPPAAGCPDAVKSAIASAFPKSTITKCIAERDKGRDQFEVKVVKADGAKAEVDLTPEGKVLQIEEVVPIDKVPTAVMNAFAAKYPKAKVDAAEKQTPATGPASYELGFSTSGGRKEATFTEDGKFVEEE